jgi:hypothetical protein
MKAAGALSTAVVALFLAGASPARADAYDAALARAVSAKERALEANDPPHWDEALRLFAEADAIRSTKESKYELGFAAAKMRQNDVAVEAYQAALDLGLVGTARTTAEAFIAQYATSMARIEIVGPPGATIYVAGRWRGRTPLARPIVVFNGPVHMQIAFGQGTNRTEDLVLPAGTLHVLRLWEPQVSSPGPATVPVPPANEAVRPPSSTEERGTNTLAWTLLGGGALLVAGGAVLVPVASSRIGDHRNDLASNCDQLSGEDACAHAKPNGQTAAQTAADGIATWKAVRTGAFVGLGVGAATLVAGVVALAAAPRSRSAHARAEVVPMYGGAVVLYGGHF